MSSAELDERYDLFRHYPALLLVLLFGGKYPFCFCSFAYLCMQITIPFCADSPDVFVFLREANVEIAPDRNLVV